MKNLLAGTMAAIRTLAFGAILTVAAATLAHSQSASLAPATLQESDATYTLDNGIVTALVSKKSGDLISLKYHGKEMLATITLPDGAPDLETDPPGDPGRSQYGMTDHMYGFWSHDTIGPRTVARITIDPKINDGERAEVSVKGFSDGQKLGHGPGAPPDGSFAADIDIRYSLGKGDSGVYTYCTFDHQPQYPEATLGEARFCVKLNDIFDWMLVDEHHNMLYPMEKERDGDNKYNYTSVQFEHPAFGWASTKQKVGTFFINTSTEYLTGPPTKVEFLCHRDTTGPAYAPCILNYWRSSHYGGGSVDVAQGEAWTKVIGPFLIYCNSGDDPQAIWKDAKEQVEREKQKWPYAWVAGVDYPNAAERAAVSGQLVLDDPLAQPDAKMSNVRVGLTFPDYHITTSRAAAINAPADITWQLDSKHYEFWTRGADDGTFTIPAVRAGKYTLHAFADGVLGEYAKTDVEVAAGKPLDLGKLDWKPVRRGKQVWQIGVPNRSGEEYVKGDDYFHDGMGQVYATMFPNDVNYTIGKSDWTKDWFYAQFPHALPPAPRPAATPTPAPTPRPAEADSATSPAQRGRGGAGARGARGLRRARGARGFGGGGGPGSRATPWTIHFDMPDAPHGKATLRFGIATANTREVAIAVNDQPAGALNQFEADSSLGRNSVRGIWYEREVAFDASMLKSGPNTITLTVPAGGLTAGIIYDCIRLELDEAAK